MTPTVPSCGDRSEEPYLFFACLRFVGGGGGRCGSLTTFPALSNPGGRQGHQPLPWLHILPSGPGLSLVLQISHGFLRSGVTDPGRCFYRPLIKTIFENASKTLGSAFLGSQKGGGKGIDDFLEGGRRTWGWEGWPQGGALGNLGGRGGVNGHIRESLGSQGRR